jgi:hypothetical protein
VEALANLGHEVCTSAGLRDGRVLPRNSPSTPARMTLLPSADTAAMLFWALLAPNQITMRKA